MVYDAARAPSSSLSGQSDQRFANPDGPNDKGLDLANLAKQARAAFAIIEMWQQQTNFDHERMERIIVGIVEQGRAYSDAITQSVTTAETGSTFASDAISFCERLRKAQGPSAELGNALRDMKEIAGKAHEGSKQMNDQFRSIRVQLFVIAKEIPGHIATVQGERLVKSNAKTHEISNNDWNGIVTQFQKAARDLDSLISHVASFINWWADMNISLQYIETNLRFITTDGSNPYRTSSVKEHWVAVKDKYASYRSQIHQVEDYYSNVSSKSYDKWLSDRSPVGKTPDKTPGLDTGTSTGSKPTPDKQSGCFSRCVIM